MTLDKARKLPGVQAVFGSFHNGNCARLISPGVQREHGQATMDQLIREPRLEEIFGFKPGARFDGGLAI